MEDSQFVKNCRVYLKLSQNKLADVLGKGSARTIRKWEEGGDVQRSDLIAISHLIDYASNLPDELKTVDNYHIHLQQLFEWTEGAV